MRFSVYCLVATATLPSSWGLTVAQRSGHGSKLRNVNYSAPFDYAPQSFQDDLEDILNIEAMAAQIKASASAEVADANLIAQTATTTTTTVDWRAVEAAKRAEVLEARAKNALGAAEKAFEAAQKNEGPGPDAAKAARTALDDAQTAVAEALPKEKAEALKLQGEALQAVKAQKEAADKAAALAKARAEEEAIEAARKNKEEEVAKAKATAKALATEISKAADEASTISELRKALDDATGKVQGEAEVVDSEQKAKSAATEKAKTEEEKLLATEKALGASRAEVQEQAALLKAKAKDAADATALAEAEKKELAALKKAYSQTKEEAEKAKSLIADLKKAAEKPAKVIKVAEEVPTTHYVEKVEVKPTWTEEAPEAPRAAEHEEVTPPDVLKYNSIAHTQERFRQALAHPDSASWPMSGPIVDIPGQGKVLGTTSWQGVAMFRSMPYALPPVGDLRWRPPQPLKPWKNVRNLTGYGPICPQLPGSINLTMFEQSEDCMVMYLSTPLGYLNTTKKLPVFVWIVGDGFVADSPVHYLGQNLVYATEYKAMVVSLGYRINVFGFLVSPQLVQRADGHGQLGFQDQQFALGWIQKYITNFAGDASKVTIFGISSGGAAVMTHLVMPRSEGLFQRAIIESGFYPEMTTTPEIAYKAYQIVLKYVKCDDLECLLKKPAMELVTAATVAGATCGGDPFNPMIDGVNLAGKPWDLIAAGKFHKMPVLLGSVRDEMAKFMLMDNTTYPNTLTWPQFDNLLAQIYPTSKEWTEEMKWAYTEEAGYDYPKVQWGYTPAYWTIMRMRTDDIFGHCSERWLARRFVQGGAPKVFLYMFNHRILPNVFVPHGSEDHWIFGPLNNTLMLQMMSYWGSFANTGDPNSNSAGTKLVHWPEYELQSDLNLRIQQTGTAVDSHFREQACKWWDRYHAEKGFNSPVAPSACVQGPPCPKKYEAPVYVLNEEGTQAKAMRKSLDVGSI